MTDVTRSVADILREAREVAGRDICDIAAELKIRVSYLEALEAGRYDVLPPPAFSAGFVRSYGNLLDLDGCALARDFRCEAGGDCSRPELNFPEPVAESRVPGRAVLLTGGAALLAVYFGWVANFGSTVAPEVAVTPVPDRLAGLSAGPANAAAIRTATPETGNEMFLRSSLSQEMDVDDGSVAGEGDAAAANALLKGGDPDTARPEEISAAPQVEADKAEDNANVDVTASLQTVSQKAKTGRTEGSPRVLLTAQTDTWFYVVDAMDREVWNGVLRAGESWAPRAGTDGPRLMTSNAGALHVLVDGKDLGPLGSGGDVVRDVLLTPDGLKRREKLAMR